jgi:hypothetical protein
MKKNVERVKVKPNSDPYVDDFKIAKSKKDLNSEGLINWLHKKIEKENNKMTDFQLGEINAFKDVVFKICNELAKGEK